MTKRRRPDRDSGHVPAGSRWGRLGRGGTRKGIRRFDDRWSHQVLPRISDKMVAAYTFHGDLRHLESRDLPSRQRTVAILNDLLTILFPSWSSDESLTEASIAQFLGSTMHSLHSRLEREVARSLRYDQIEAKRNPRIPIDGRARTIAEQLLGALPRIKHRLSADVRSAFEDDPAAKSLDEVVLSYPCLYAIATHRIAHELYVREVPIMPRIMSEHAHSLTGVDIHPGARIGNDFFIDHGTGVVIGETAEIGNNVRIYQGVTIGAKSLSPVEVSELRGKKRHPTIEDDVVIYSGATILGASTVIGRGSVIGGNVWVTSSIPPHTTVAIAPPKLRRLT